MHGVLASERAMDKVVSKALFRNAGIPVPHGYAFSKEAFSKMGAADALPEIQQSLGLPLCVKPACQGSALGISIVLDDFGTGSTNLVSLAGLPVDQLKIDRSCSVGLEAEGAAYDTMSELLDASKRLHLPACAAGIETSTQEMVLKQLGCVYGQGYLYFAPLDPDEVAGVVATQPFRGADQP